MICSTRVGLLAATSALVLTAVSPAGAAAEAQDVEARIAELEAEVAQLKGENWLTEERAEEVRSLVQDVLADADTRASLLANGITAGYDQGFVLSSTNGDFSLRMNGQLQTRFIFNMQDEDASDDSTRAGFENSRTKLIFTGNVAGPEWFYRVEGNFNRNFGDFSLNDGYIRRDVGNGWSVQAGQFRLPILREYLVHSADQLAVERSNVSYSSFASNSQGIQANYTGEAFRAMLAFTDGVFGDNSPWSVRDVEYALTGRAEFLVGGNWDQFEDFTSPRGSEQGLLIGGAAHYEQEAFGTAAMNELQILQLTGDVSFEGDGFNAFGALIYTSLDNDNGIESDRFGVVVQGGVYFTDQIEGFARFEWQDFDSAADDLSILTLGANYYFNENVTLTTDLGFGFDSVDSAFDITGWRTDAGDEDGQIVLRTQLELLF